MHYVNPPIKKIYFTTTKYPPPKKYRRQFLWGTDDKVYKNTVQNWHYRHYSLSQREIPRAKPEGRKINAIFELISWQSLVLYWDLINFKRIVILNVLIPPLNAILGECPGITRAINMYGKQHNSGYWPHSCSYLENKHFI